MDVKYINPFLTAFKEVVSQVLGTKPDFKKPFLKNTPFNTEDILILFGITGEISGKILVNLDKASCVKIASQMMGGMAVEYNEISKSAVGELFNMILGNTASLFAGQGISINITSPTILEGNNIKVSQKEQIICVPVSISENITLSFNIASEKLAA